MTDERPPGLGEVESEPKTQGEEQSQVESEQEAQEEESGRAREEEKRAQEAREEQRRAHEAREEERRAQEEREEGVSAQEEQVEAQEGHEGEEAMTTQEKCVEEQKETNSMHEESHVSNRRMTWWHNAWWIRVDNGPHMRSARGRRRVWRAARRAAEQARNEDGAGEVQRLAEEAEREKWERRQTDRQTD